LTAEYPTFVELGSDVEMRYDDYTEHLNRTLNVQAGWDYATHERIVRVAVSRDRRDWEFRHDFDHNWKNVHFTKVTREHDPERDLDHQVTELISEVKDEIDLAERACSQTTVEALEGLLESE
jgi:hypothetical protein